MVDSLPCQVITVEAADAGATLITADLLINVVIRWLAPTTLTHVALIRDAGNTIDQWTANCSVINADYPESRIPFLNGLVVPTLQSGTLEIHYSDRRTRVSPQGTPVITNNSPIS